jgi:ABC-2 type transport system ATP-binding protein
MSLLIEAQNLYRYYGQRCVIDNLSLSLKKGDVLGLLGVNGAGKTTTLQMLSGNLTPNSGEIRLNGIDLLKRPLLAKQYLGYLAEQPPLYPDLTVVEFLSYCAQLHRLAKNRLSAAVQMAQQRCGLTQVSNRLIAQLSKGYQQRLGIAQAIVHQPPVIILDEPTVGLDPLQITEIRQLIQFLTADHGIILSTHSLAEVQANCSHVLILHQGQLIFNQSLSQLKQQTQITHLKLTTRIPIDISALIDIEGVIAIDTLAETQYLIQYSALQNPIETITAIVISQQWGLIEIKPLESSLESLFIHVTQNSETLNP